MSEMAPANADSVPAIAKIKASMRSAWMAGDFGVVARTIHGAAEEFVARLAVLPGMAALDVACGTGNVTLPLARRGAVATGVDIAPNLLVQARERASAAGLKVTFDEGDAEALPYADASFDVVTSMFGAMFAPRPEVVAAELARVLKPGGLLAMANWNPAGFSGRMFRVNSGHAGGPSNVPAPVLWGDEETVRLRLAGKFEEIRTELIAVDFDLPTNPAGAVAFFREYFGPTKVAFSRLDEAGQARFAGALEELWAGANVARDPEHHTLVRNEFLQVTARRVG
jgi:SAM-dependent methyltransferase